MMYIQTLKLMLTDIKEMFRSSPQMFILLVFFTALAKYVPVTAEIQFAFIIIALSISFRIACADVLIRGSMTITNKRKLALFCLADLVLFSLMIVSVYVSSGSEASEAGPELRALAYVFTVVMTYLVIPLAHVWSLMWLMMIYYGGTEDVNAYITAKLTNPTALVYMFIGVGLTMISSIGDAVRLVSTIVVIGLYRRFVFETPPRKKRERKTVRKVAEAL